MNDINPAHEFTRHTCSGKAQKKAACQYKRPKGVQIQTSLGQICNHSDLQNPVDHTFMPEPFLIHNVYIIILHSISIQYQILTILIVSPLHRLVFLDLRRGTCLCPSLPTRFLGLGGVDALRPVSYGGLEFPDPLLQQLRGLLVLRLPRQVDVLVLVQDLNAMICMKFPYG